ncbi:MAG: sodium:solute symporter family protein [Desulfovibrio sp.]|uniref:sodium:solute symporter family protein n=1 Tax=Desulfovibrio sp. 7SRBS1 TaxID=3378064 RepID=UPI003B4163A2
MQFVDYAVLVAYFCALLFIGYRGNKKHTGAEDYYVGGRSQGALSLMALWMSSWVGGAAIMGSAEKSFSMGITFLWYPLSMFCGFIIFGLTFAGRIKRLGDKYSHITYPDLIEQRYDSRTRIVSTVTTILAYIGYTASQLLGAAHIINSITGLGLGLAFVVATSVTILYTSVGGFFAVERTDRFQALLMILGLTVVAVPLTLNDLGGFSRLTTELPDSYFQMGTWGWGTIAAMFISMVLTFFTSMDGYTRCYAAKSERSARNGTLLAAFFVLVVSGSICFLGMSSKVLFPNAAGGTTALVTLIIKLFPVGLKGLILVAILSAIMSTADTCILCASANLTRDIYHRYINPNAPQKRILRLSMVSSFVVGITGALIGWYSKDIMALLIMTFTVNSAGLFVPTVGVFLWKWASARAAFWSMTLSLVVVVAWYVGQALFPLNPLLAVDPVWPGLLMSVGVFFTLAFKEHRFAMNAAVSNLP